MEERRKHKRLTEKMIVAYRLPKEAKIEQITTSENVSADGIRIVIPKNTIKGDTVSVDINVFNDAIPILAKGEVVWIKKITSKEARKGKKSDQRKFMVGIKFNKFDRFDGERIIKYITRKLQKQ
ncbi:MAG: PilZ domain-containing protein [Omnitrophica bacterium]|nr:PilZ domain-containing protein [Candidatus Omnitrophota bacterium]